MRLKIAIKCLVTALLLWVAFRTVDIAAVASLLSSLNPWWALVALLLTGLIILFDATLLSSVIRLFSRRMPFGTAMLYSVVGWFFSNVAPSTVGGDIFRGCSYRASGCPSELRSGLSSPSACFPSSRSWVSSPQASRLHSNCSRSRATSC
nr:lysylphosphatidylglycerol synthase transmembrane domain-containing protein [Sphingomonas sediminicola]